MGPSLDLVVKRSKLASDDLYKRSRKQPKEAKVSINNSLASACSGRGNAVHGCIQSSGWDVNG